MPKLIYHDSDGLDKVVPVGSEPVLIGRATECQVQTQDAMVSRRHARIYWDGNYWIEDLGSSNGVYVGNDKVQKAPFRPGDTVTCGSLVLRLMPDTTPRATGNMAPMTGSMAPLATTPPRSASVAPPPPLLVPPPMAPPPPPRTPPPASRSSGSLPTPASPHATTDAQANLADELRNERQRREHAESALLTAADRLRAAEARVTEFEAAAGQAPLLQRKLDQAQADLRRLRGGQPSEGPREDGELPQLRARIVELEAALTLAARSSASPSSDEARLKRQVDQLQAELSRARTGSGDAAAGTPRGTVDPATNDAAIALGDSLAELRASLRAASDEAGLLTAPAQSVQVVGDALQSAAEQLEAARAHLRALAKLLGVH